MCFPGKRNFVDDLNHDQFGAYTEIEVLCIFIAFILLILLICCLCMQWTIKRTVERAVIDETEVLNWGEECVENFDATMTQN